MGSEEQERWRRIALVFDQAVSLSPEERSAFLDGACHGDTELRQQVTSLLLSSDRASGFLGEPFPLIRMSIPIDRQSSRSPPSSIPFGETRTQAPSPLASAAELIGTYRLIERIGEGGTGEVWLAEQGDGRTRGPDRHLSLAWRHSRPVGGSGRKLSIISARPSRSGSTTLGSFPGIPGSIPFARIPPSPR